MNGIFELILYLVGFIIYIFFCVLTFEVYSKKKEMTKSFILIFIFIYYSMLANYVIFFILFDKFLIKKIIIFLVYIFLGAFFLSSYYEKHIKIEDEKLYRQNV